MAEENNIFSQVKQAIVGLFSGYVAGNEGVNAERAEQLMLSLITLYNQADEFLDKVSQQDELFETFSEFAEVEEYCFDLLMINFFASDSRYLDEDFMESKEWADIEEKTLDRGTELLNIFLYLYEAQETDAEVSIEDFLNEFLLAEDELYQDEYFIYESLIVHQDLIDAGVADMLEVHKDISNNDIKDIFIPLLLFFNEDTDLEKVTKALNKKLTASALTVALLYSITAFYEGVQVLPKTLAKFN